MIDIITLVFVILLSAIVGAMIADIMRRRTDHYMRHRQVLSGFEIIEKDKKPELSPCDVCDCVPDERCGKDDTPNGGDGICTGDGWTG